MAIVRRPASVTSFAPLSDWPARLRHEMDELFHRFFEGPRLFQEGWVPPLRIEETDNELVVIAELPGVASKDLSVTLEGGELVLSGERKELETIKGASLYVDELASGAFSRRFPLPCEVVADKISADYKDGFVRITLPKAPSARRVKIPINVVKKS